MADEEASTPVLVDPAISAAKLDRELDHWSANADTYHRRGWRLLGRESLQVKVMFAGRIGIGSPTAPAPVALPVLTACVQIVFDNYDLWPPSVGFVDYFSGESTYPPVNALRWEAGVEQNVLVRPPGARFPFLCLPGVREYHNFHEHSGDDWLLHRGRGTGTLAAICEQIWQRMALNVIGVRLEGQLLPLPEGQHLSAFQASLLQADLASVQAQLLPQLAAAGVPSVQQGASHTGQVG